jgi:GATA-binding protein, other eukaryote
MEQEHPPQLTSDMSGSGSAETQLNMKPSGSSSTTTTEHDFRFPRRPADQQQRQQPQGTSSSSRSQHVFLGTSRGLKDKLDFTGLDNVSKELLRESYFPTWKDDASGAELDNPDEMQKKDPLATQIWRLYSKTKKQLPNQERMENLTWRMMAMNLRKRKQEDAARYVMTVMCIETWNNI